MAEIDVPVEKLDILPLKNVERCDSHRLRKLMRSIRRNGYNSLDPVIVRLSPRGSWVIIDGGHRVTAARQVAKEFFANLFSAKVSFIHFLLYRTPLSETQLTDPKTEANLSS